MVAAKSHHCITEFVIISRVSRKRAKHIIFDRYLEDNQCRVHLQSEGITEEKVKEWNRIVSGPKREHALAEAEREHWKSTYYLKQTTAGGADCGHHRASRFANSKRMASRAFSSTRKQYFHTTTDFPAASGKNVNQFKFNIKKMAKEDRKTRTLTLTNLKQRRTFERPKA